MQASDVLSFPPIEDDMPLNREDKQWVRSQIREATQPQPKQAWRIKEWSIAGIAVAIILALGTACVTLGIYVASDMKENGLFRGRTETRLDHIEATLLELRASQSPKSVLKDLSTLDQNQFAKSLPALRKVSEQPVSQVAPAPEILHDVTLKLQHVDPNTPEYWQTVLQFIQFASNGLASNAPPPGSPVNATLTDVSGLRLSAKGVYVLRGGVIANMRFEDSRIVFTSNPVQLRNVTFVNCAFDFPDVNIPSPYLENAGRQLLASDFGHISDSGL